MDRIPAIGLGTWTLYGRECVKVVSKALDLGYRHIDTALNYDNHQAIGKAIQGKDRGELFITSKTLLSHGDLESVCHNILQDLKTDYLDLLLIHWPDSSKPIPPILKAIENLKSQGKIRHFGVSNFTIHHLQDFLEMKAPIFCNQVEFHPYLFQKDLYDFCKRFNIEIVAYRPLGKGQLLKEPILQEIAKRSSKNVSQVLLSWLFQKKIPFIVKARSDRHLQENLEVISSQMSLSREDAEALDNLNKNHRFCNQPWGEFEY